LKIQTSRDKITLVFTSEYPFTEDELEENVLELGYEIPESNPTVISMSADGRQSLAKRYSKENVEILYDSERGFLSAEGSDIEKTAEAFGDVIQIAEILCGTNAESKIKWSEFFFECRVKANKDPLSVFDKTLKLENGEDLEAIFGMPVSPYGLSIYSSDESGSDKPLNEIENWSHITFQPFVRNPKYYYGRIVYRKEDVKDVSDMAFKVKEIVEDLIEYLERD